MVETECIVTLSVLSMMRSISSDYGLYRALLKLLPLSKGFNLVPLGRIERPLSKKEKVRGPDDSSIPASDPFAAPKEIGC
jgi:hypothetical protein